MYLRGTAVKFSCWVISCLHYFYGQRKNSAGEVGGWVGGGWGGVHSLYQLWCVLNKSTVKLMACPFWCTAFFKTPIWLWWKKQLKTWNRSAEHRAVLKWRKNPSTGSVRNTAKNLNLLTVSSNKRTKYCFAWCSLLPPHDTRVMQICVLVVMIRISPSDSTLSHLVVFPVFVAPL